MDIKPPSKVLEWKSQFYHVFFFFFQKRTMICWIINTCFTFFSWCVTQLRTPLLENRPVFRWSKLLEQIVLKKKNTIFSCISFALNNCFNLATLLLDTFLAVLGQLFFQLFALWGFSIPPSFEGVKFCSIRYRLGQSKSLHIFPWWSPLLWCQYVLGHCLVLHDKIPPNWISWIFSVYWQRECFCYHEYHHQ